MRTEPTDDEVERRLTVLEEESDRRRAELSAVLDGLPAAVSRRDVVASGFRDLRDDTGDGSIIRGVRRSITRAAEAVVARVRSRRTR